MNNLSTYLRNALSSTALRAAAYTPPTTVYLALYTADPTPDDTPPKFPATLTRAMP